MKSMMGSIKTKKAEGVVAGETIMMFDNYKVLKVNPVDNKVEFEVEHLESGQNTLLTMPNDNLVQVK